jgi:hypothetical protein
MKLSDFPHLPDLPEIDDAGIQRQVFAHTSFIPSLHRVNAQYAFDRGFESYDKLEHVGDRLLGLSYALIRQHVLIREHRKCCDMRIEGSIPGHEDWTPKRERYITESSDPYN